MKDLTIIKLNDVYGAMLTDKQSDVVVQYYELDYSLGEIGENLSITRQGVFDTLKCAVNKLKDCEKKLGFSKKLITTEQILQNGLKSDSAEEKNNAIKNALEILNGG